MDVAPAAETKKRRTLPQPGLSRSPWAPIEVWYKGKARRVTDGLGLNSPGIRPAGHRGPPIDPVRRSG